MLERYFVKPATVDRVRASWIGGPIEQYIGWCHQRLEFHPKPPV
jgi:integrase/recombinase XerD